MGPDVITQTECNMHAGWLKRRHARSADSRLPRVALIPKNEQLSKRAIGLVDETHPLRNLASEVLVLTSQIETSVYDLCYLALAKKADATLIAADQAFCKGGGLGSSTQLRSTGSGRAHYAAGAENFPVSASYAVTIPEPMWYIQP